MATKETRKTIGLNQQNNNLIFTCITFFCPWPLLNDCGFKCPRLMREVNSRPQFSFLFFNLKLVFQNSFPEKSPLFQNLNEVELRRCAVVHTFSHAGVVQNITCIKLWRALIILLEWEPLGKGFFNFFFAQFVTTLCKLIKCKIRFLFSLLRWTTLLL